jgi:hypothetical protein
LWFDSPVVLLQVADIVAKNRNHMTDEKQRATLLIARVTLESTMAGQARCAFSWL